MLRAVSPSRLVRLGSALALLGVVTAAGPAATAGRPSKVAYPVDISYPLDDLTQVCGFDVWFRLVGVFKGTLFRDRSGTIVGEFDSQPNTTQTFSAPDSGKSFSYKFATTFHNSYPDGIEPGDRVVARVTGFLEKIPGLPARAGHATFPNGEVLFVDDGGVPIVDYGEPSQDIREKYTGDDADAAICAALAP